MAVVEADPYAEVKVRLRDELPLYSSNFLKVVDRQKVVPFELKPAQARLWRALEAQRAQGKPGRALILKARKIGFSTMAQGIILQRVTQRPNHNALTVAQDNKTAQELFRIAEVMYSHLPGGDEHPDLAFLKPGIAHQRRQRELVFGEDSRQRLKGSMGLNSKMMVDTAGEFEAGRGHTFHTLHLSEAAFWPDLKRKLTSLLNTVPQDDPDTMVLIESTANGHNHFRQLWVDAEQGGNDYVPFFSPWFEDARYARKFISEDERAGFLEDLGRGAWGEDEPELLDLVQSRLSEWTDLSEDECYERTLRHLNWRRWAIENLAGRDLQIFNQEYPATPAMAFVVSGRHVFAPLAVQDARKHAELTDPDAREVILSTTSTVMRRGRYVSVDVPTAFKESPRNPTARSDLFWRVWEQPKPKGQYLIVVDPASGEENTDAEPDFTGVIVMDHHTGEQVAELETRADPDLVAEQVYLMALKYSVKPNLPTVVVEMTGGYGTSIVDRVWKEFGWKRMYFRRPIDPRRRDKSSDLVGFSTDRHTKPRLVDGMRELFRERNHGIKSLKVVKQAESYQRSKTGKTGAAPGSHDDLLMPYMVGQYVRQERPPRPERKAGSVVNTAMRTVRSSKTGY